MVKVREDPELPRGTIHNLCEAVLARFQRRAVPCWLNREPAGGWIRVE